jgi:hypothetical protein
MRSEGSSEKVSDRWMVSTSRGRKMPLSPPRRSFCWIRSRPASSAGWEMSWTRRETPKRPRTRAK